eukprot:gene11962-35133_t
MASYQMHGEGEAHRASAWTPEERARVNRALDQPPGPEYVASRAGPGGKKILYMEGWRVFSMANEVFGPDGWSTTIKDVSCDFVDRDKSGTFMVGFAAIVRVTTKNGAFHEDIGYGTGQQKIRLPHSKRFVAHAFTRASRARKQAITDATKRALNKFGNALGGCITDKSYQKAINRHRRDAEPDTYELENMKRPRGVAPAVKRAPPQQQQPQYNPPSAVKSVKASNGIDSGGSGSGSGGGGGGGVVGSGSTTAAGSMGGGARPPPRTPSGAGARAGAGAGGSASASASAAASTPIPASVADEDLIDEETMLMMMADMDNDGEAFGNNG